MTKTAALRRAGAVIAAGCGAIVALLAAGAASAAAHPTPTVRVLAQFDPSVGQNPENLAVARDGTVYVTWLFAHSVVAIHSDGGRAVVVLPAGEASGVAIDPAHPDRLAVGLISSDPADSGIWTVPLSAFDGRGTQARRIALPVQAFPNGLTFAADGTLYIADSTGGAILRVAPGAATATTWLAADLLTPTGATFDAVPLPGVNGLKLHQGELYATNTARGLLLRIPIHHSTPGTPIIVRSGLPFDDFAIDDHGVITAALNIDNEVVRFAGGGPIVVLADKTHDDVQNPSAVAFGPNHEIFVTSAAYFGTRPALQAITPEHTGR